MPLCPVGWINQKAAPPLSSNESISLPVYYSSDRYKLVANLDLPIGHTPKTMWIQCGAALFLNN